MKASSSDSELAVRILADAGLPDVPLSSGAIRVLDRDSWRSRIEPDRQKALDEFLGFGGEGWLCLADQRELLRLSAEGSTPMRTGSWPWKGEWYAGPVSLHLSRCESGWELTYLESAPSVESASVLAERRFLDHDHRTLLRYHVEWAPCQVGDHDELRPVRFRFLGFLRSPAPENPGPSGSEGVGPPDRSGT